MANKKKVLLVFVFILNKLNFTICRVTFYPSQKVVSRVKTEKVITKRL